MITLSLAMIVKNEEAVLARCLDCVKEIVDEIIIVDTGSTDATVEIARTYTDKIYHYEWHNHFAAARNFSFSKATGDYIMWLDADDVLEASEQRKLLALKQDFDTDIDVALLKYNVGFDADGNVTMSNYRERILKRASDFRWEEPVHECIAPRGKIERFDIAVTHGEKVRAHSDRNLKIYEAQSELSPRGMFYYARELRDHGRLEEAVVQYKAFLEDGRGWLEDNIRACLDIAGCYTGSGQARDALNQLFQTFVYDRPRSEACYKIGDYFFEQNSNEQAIYWYDLATNPNSQVEAGFVNRDFCDFLPYLQLCIVFDRLGKHDLAYNYHLQTKALKPEHASVLYNDKYFEKLFSE
ncbi:MAG: glycosyltransferase family 2 protein [Turicibacter sp.]|nr:glycosyltransferase family 2 protein [Turicibacter sp.]